MHTRQSQTLPEESSVDSLADNDVGELEVSLVDAGGRQEHFPPTNPTSVLVSAVAGEINPEARADQLTFSQLKSRL